MFAAPEKPENIGKKTEQEPQNLNKLFANINFIGELYKEQMLADVILYSIFDKLLGLDIYTANDITVEAALLLINKLGSKLEQDTKAKNDDRKVEA